MESHPNQMLWLLLAAILLATGCQSHPNEFNGNIRFVNDSDTNLEWVEVEGFSSNPPVGVLGAGVFAESLMQPMPWPDQFTIRWALETDPTAFVSQAIVLSGISPPKDGETLVVAYNSDNVWAIDASKP